MVNVLRAIDHSETYEFSDNPLSNGEDYLQNIVTNALLVATAFRLRDEEALVHTLRRLTNAVDKLEKSTALND